ncbi:hypothetical protein L3X38_032430 [Prunus dulcis]|uniref:Reverse transcriptase domain-containing protein n=1 Tax=Prunus dulcis TaxID=3755 RepID=A0AAD4VEC9_PRUDU|nr:hypothetical protein L3X38_032430 [Prunus dulcis]
MKAEVEKLRTIGFIREATYPIWLANSVMARKVKGGWQICQDYTDMNKACPKESFSLPQIDQLVNATVGHELLRFMDAYSGYNLIFMHPTDSEHTTFITDKGLHCYNVTPFGLKNVKATYQRLVNRIFAKHIGSTMEVYVDDMLVKSKTADEHLHNLSLISFPRPPISVHHSSKGARSISHGRHEQGTTTVKTLSWRDSVPLSLGIAQCHQFSIDKEASLGRLNYRSSTSVEHYIMQSFGWRMRRLFRFPVSRAQGISARILLANHASRCNCNGEELWQMPMIRKRTLSACRTTHTNHKSMAFCPMGARSDRPNATRKGPG